MEYKVKYADRRLWTSKLFLEIRGAKELYSRDRGGFICTSAVLAFLFQPFTATTRPV